MIRETGVPSQVESKTQKMVLVEIFKQIYVIHWWNSNRYYHSGSEWSWEQCTDETEFSKAPVVETRYLMQFSVVPKAPFVE